MKQEFTGKDIDTAIAAACSALQVSRKDLQYEVLSTGASGIFGIVGRRDAKIRVTQSAPPSSQPSDTDMEGIKSIVDEAFGQESPKAARPSKPRRPKKQDSAQADTYVQNQENQPGSSQARDDQTQDPQIHEEDLDFGNYEQEPEQTSSFRLPAADVTQPSIDLGREAVQKMADLITDDAVVTAHAQEDVLTLKIEGGNSGILIGRKGQTLDAMQFLADKMINRQSEDRVRVRMDVEGYMETRKANLRHLAQKMASRAKKTGRPSSINQMNAQDRRIIHMALKNDSQIRTQSVGEGYYRRLVIFPKNKYKGNKASGK